MSASSFLASAPRIPPDAIFALTAQYNADPFPRKVNLGQGTYRNEKGLPWVLPSVAAARESLFQQGLYHEYLPITGLAEFRQATCDLVLGSSSPRIAQKQIASCQSLSGTGALHLAAILIRKCHASGKTELPEVFIPEPTWSNHSQVFESAGFECNSFSYYDAKRKALDWNAYLNTLKSIKPGSIIILHACAHNPSGIDPSQEQWREIGNIMKERELFPLFDAAYLGFNSGNIDADAFPIRYFVNDLGLDAAMCLSFAKNMGLYGERVGCVIMATSTEDIALNVQSTLEQLQRSEVSNPPAFGAKIASTILTNKTLREMWYQDLITMSSRIRQMRAALSDSLVANGAPGSWNHILRQSGMFGFLGLPREIVLQLRSQYHIYMADNSRISLAGLNENNVEYVARSIAECLKQTQPQKQQQASL